CPLFTGTLDGQTLVCPCHDWRYDVTTGDSSTRPSSDSPSTRTPDREHDEWETACSGSGRFLRGGRGVALQEVDLTGQHIGEAGAAFVDVVVTTGAGRVQPSVPSARLRAQP